MSLLAVMPKKDNWMPRMQVFIASFYVSVTPSFPVEVYAPFGCATTWRHLTNGPRPCQPRSLRTDSSSRKTNCVLWRKPERKKQAHGEIETEHPSYLGCQASYYVGNIKGVGCIYQLTFIDSYCKTVMVKLYDRKHAITAADMLNDRVRPGYEGNGVYNTLTDIYSLS